MKVSRSRLVGTAIRAYLDTLDNRELLKKINDACEHEDSSDRTRIEAMSAVQRETVKGEW